MYLVFIYLISCYLDKGRIYENSYSNVRWSQYTSSAPHPGELEIVAVFVVAIDTLIYVST